MSGYSAVNLLSGLHPHPVGPAAKGRPPPGYSVCRDSMVICLPSRCLYRIVVKMYGVADARRLCQYCQISETRRGIIDLTHKSQASKADCGFEMIWAGLEWTGLMERAELCLGRLLHQ